jgi:hypothetical protein
MSYKNAVFVLSLVVLSGCSNSYEITYDSEPQGATLICSGTNEGYTPVEIDYAESIRNSPTANLSHCSANWASGAVETYRDNVTIYPSGDGTITTVRRSKGRGYAEDAAFALRVKQMQADERGTLGAYVGGGNPAGWDELQKRTVTQCYRMDNKISLGQSMCVTK